MANPLQETNESQEVDHGSVRKGYFHQTSILGELAIRPLKLAMLALGIVVGAYFADLWKPYLWLVGLIFVILATWVTMMWMGAMRGAA